MLHKILIIEDRKTITEIVVELVSDKFDVVVAHSGEEARQCLKKALFSLALVDFDLGVDKKTGINLLADIQDAHIPIMLLSDSWDAAKLRTTISLGILAFVDKESKTPTADAALSDDEQPDMQVFAEKKVPFMNLKETRVLEHLYLFPAHTNPQIAESCHLTIGQVKRCLTMLFIGFDVVSRHELIDEARRLGFRPHQHA